MATRKKKADSQQDIATITRVTLVIEAALNQLPNATNRDIKFALAGFSAKEAAAGKPHIVFISNMPGGAAVEFLVAVTPYIVRREKSGKGTTIRIDSETSK